MTPGKNGQPPDKIRVLIVEDEPLFRDLLRVALSQQSRLEMVGAFADAASAAKEARQLTPDVAILDLDLGGDVNGVKLGMELRREMPKLGIVLLSNYQEPHLLSALPPNILSGWSYLLKKSIGNIDSLERAIEGAAAGLVVMDPLVVAGVGAKPSGLLSRLTPRQKDVLDLIVGGYTNSAIAEKLFLSPKSVENMINVLYQQLEIDREDSSIHPRVRAVLIHLRESQGLPRDQVSGT